MDDYISREAAIEALRPYKVDTFKIGFIDDTIDGFNDGIDTAISKLTVMQAADVRPVVRAHWIDMKPINMETGLPICIKGPDFRCSNCGSAEFQRNFCPNCGADMRGIENGA